MMTPNPPKHTQAEGYHTSNCACFRSPSFLPASKVDLPAHRNPDDALPSGNDTAPSGRIWKAARVLLISTGSQQIRRFNRRGSTAGHTAGADDRCGKRSLPDTPRCVTAHPLLSFFLFLFLFVFVRCIPLPSCHACWVWCGVLCMTLNRCAHTIVLRSYQRSLRHTLNWWLRSSTTSTDQWINWLVSRKPRSPVKCVCIATAVSFRLPRETGWFSFYLRL